MDGGAWYAAVHGVAKSPTRLGDFPFTFHFHALEKEMAAHSSVLAWRIPGTGEPGELPSMGSHRVGHNWSDLAAAVAAAYDICLPLSGLLINRNLDGFDIKGLLELNFCYSRWASSVFGKCYGLEVHERGRGELPCFWGKEQRLCFAWAAMQRDPRSKVRETQVTW